MRRLVLVMSGSYSYRPQMLRHNAIRYQGLDTICVGCKQLKNIILFGKEEII
jgi:hypothetical protein